MLSATAHSTTFPWPNQKAEAAVTVTGHGHCHRIFILATFTNLKAEATGSLSQSLDIYFSNALLISCHE